MDFFGGSTGSLDHLFRIRTAAMKLDWTNTSFMVRPGQADHFAARSGLAGAGGRFAAHRSGQFVAMAAAGSSGAAVFLWATQADLVAQAGVFQTSVYDFPMNASLYSPPPSSRKRNTRGRAWKAASSSGIAGAKRSASKSPADSITTAITFWTPVATFGGLLAGLVRSAAGEAGVLGHVLSWPECFAAGRAAAGFHGLLSTASFRCAARADGRRFVCPSPRVWRLTFTAASRTSATRICIMAASERIRDISAISCTAWRPT